MMHVYMSLLLRWHVRYGGDIDGDVVVQEVTQRILEAVGGIAGSSLEQTSWLSRSLEVKVQPQVCAEADEPDDADADGDHYGNFCQIPACFTSSASM